MADTQYVWMLGPGEPKPVKVEASKDDQIVKLMYQGFKQVADPNEHVAPPTTKEVR